jgi:peroxiredoxin (alkyl hydroperoxide reductase subunit C)
LAISVDNQFSHLHHLLSKRSQGGLAELNYLLVLNLNQTITNKYRLLINDGLSFPGVFIIDKERIIQYCNRNNLLCGRSIIELLYILKSIQYIKQNPGQACPVDWKYGDQILYSHHLKSKVYFKTLYFNK